MNILPRSMFDNYDPPQHPDNYHDQTFVFLFSMALNSFPLLTYQGNIQPIT